MYVIAVELMLEPVLSCHGVLPAASSIAMNSPVNLPANTCPLPVASMSAELGKSVNRCSPFHLAGQRIERLEVTEEIAWLDLRELVVDAGGVRANDLVFGWRGRYA